ncbi:MAG: hypothetical protein HYZ14_10445 [Bacteroidetes bacterium]|nr:hypothetical protein [Bacteroidota bacterium]
MTGSSSQIKSLSIIHLALIAGQVFFAAVCIALTGKTEIILNPEGDIFFILVPAVAVFGLIGSNMIFKKLLDQAKQKTTDDEKISAYRSALIVRYALMEAPSLLGIVAYFLQGNLFYLFISGFIILFFMTARPTKEKTEMDLNIRLNG